MVNRRWVAFASGAAGVLLTLGCGPEFHLYGASTSTGEGGGGSANATMSSSSTGDGGTMNNTPCTVGDLSTCNKGNYCQSSTSQCVPCANISARFIFGVPKKLNISLPQGGTNPRLVRIGPGGQLLFTYASQFSGLDIGHADQDKGFLQWKQGEQEPAPITSTLEESAPLYLTKGSALRDVLSNPAAVNPELDVILYTSRTSGTPQVYAFNPPGKTDSTVSPVALKGGLSTSNIALSYEAPSPRFWFSTNLNSMSEGLYTSLPKETPQPLPIKLDNDCLLQTPGVAPWVSPDGTWLLFGAQRPDENKNCMVDPTAPYRLYYAQLDPTSGQQMDSTQATRIYPESTKNYTFPSLALDMCVLLFSELVDSNRWESYASVRE